MRRRDFIKAAAAVVLQPFCLVHLPRGAAAREALPSARFRRVRPSDAAWPSQAQWDALARATHGPLLKLRSPLDECRVAPDGQACADIFRELKNPYYVEDDPALTQTCGWLDAWSAQPSVYALAAHNAADVAAAVNFARDKNLRLVVKGAGHSYLGTSNAPDSLLIWTHRMNQVVMHDSFVAQGCVGRQPAQQAVSVGAGAIWIQVYNEVTTRHARYVQGGGCATVGVAGLVLGGGFGSYSKNYGTAAANLLEAEVVTADGTVRIANPCVNPDLFWALKGGGGGTFGVVTRLTLRTHPLPGFFGFVVAAVQAATDDALWRLLERFMAFYAARLHNPHWGEIVNVTPDKVLDIQMSFQGLTEKEAQGLWQPFLEWVQRNPRDFSFIATPIIRAIPAEKRWDAAFIRAQAPWAIREDDRNGAPKENIYWSANASEAGHFIYGYGSMWLSSSLLRADARRRLAQVLAAAARHAKVELHFQKGLAGGSQDAIARTRDSCTNPDVIDAFALAITGSEGPPAFPAVTGHHPDLAIARRNADAVGRAMAELRRLAENAGSYVAESDYFLRDWQSAYWGSNYKRLLAIKKKYDPSGLFFVHHGVGSEGWSADGFTRLGDC
jgi:FAD/FMN-containing dehydrogenase